MEKTFLKMLSLAKRVQGMSVLINKNKKMYLKKGQGIPRVSCPCSDEGRQREKEGKRQAGRQAGRKEGRKERKEGRKEDRKGGREGGRKEGGREEGRKEEREG